MQFNKEDVTRVAQAVVDNAPYYESAGNNYSGFDGHSCTYCNAAKEEHIDKIVHDLDCVALVAQDLLT